MVIKLVWYWYKDKHLGQWNRIESIKISPHLLITGEEKYQTFNGERIVFSRNSAGTKLYAHAQEGIELLPHPYTKMNSKTPQT